MSHDRRFPHYALDDAGRLSSEITCHSCGYNLRGLSPDGVCPECGTAIRQSLLGDFLYFSDPVWLRRIVRGMDILHIGLAGFFAVACGMLVLLARDNVQLSAAAGTSCAILAFPLIGLWRATLPESSDRADAIRFSWRFFVRLAILINASWLLGALFLPQDTRLINRQDAVSISIALILVLFAGYLFYLRSLARRTYDRELSASFTGVIIGWCAICVGVTVLFAYYFNRLPRSSLMSAFAAMTTCLGPFILLLLIAMTPALLLPFRERLSRIADLAAETRRNAEADGAST